MRRNGRKCASPKCLPLVAWAVLHSLPRSCAEIPERFQLVLVVHIQIWSSERINDSQNAFCFLVRNFPNPAPHLANLEDVVDRRFQLASRTGASGYIGGQVLHELARSHPDYEITALLRDEKKAKTIQEAYPKVRIVIGDLDNEALIEQEAAKASIVLRVLPTKLLTPLVCANTSCC